MARRANTEGTITKRADGRWEAKLSLMNGRRSFYGKTRQEVLAKLKAAQRAVADNLPLGSERVTVQLWLERWLENIVPHRTRPRTAHRYGEIVRYHLAPHLGHIRLARLTPGDVEGMMRKSLDAGQSPQSVAHHRAVLRNALTSAIKHQVIARNAAALADPPRTPEREYEALTLTRARDILQAVERDRLEALYMLLLACGPRSGEALGLRWSDLDLSAGTLAVQRTLQRIDGKWEFLEPKTRRSRRTIPLPAPLAQALKAHQARQALEHLALGPAWEGELWGGLVFTNKAGGPLHGDTVNHHLQRLLARSGLPRMRVHDLRHGTATLLAAMGVPARLAMEILGHSEISTTLNRYTHVTEDWQREAMDQVGRVLWG